MAGQIANPVGGKMERPGTSAQTDGAASEISYPGTGQPLLWIAWKFTMPKSRESEEGHMLERKRLLSSVFQNRICAQRLYHVIELKRRGDGQTRRRLVKGEYVVLGVLVKPMPLISHLASRRGEAMLASMVIILVESCVLRFDQRVSLGCLCRATGCDKQFHSATRPPSFTPMST